MGMKSEKRFGSDPRRFSLMSKEFTSKDGLVTGLKTVEIEWVQKKNGKMKMKEIASSENLKRRLSVACTWIYRPRTKDTQ